MKQDILEINGWAEERIDELTREIEYYINEGFDKEKAIGLVKNSTTLTNKCFAVALATIQYNQDWKQYSCPRCKKPYHATSSHLKHRYFIHQQSRCKVEIK